MKTRSRMNSVLMFAAVAIATLATTAVHADVVTPVIAYGHNNRDNFGGNITDIYNGSGMNGFPYTGDPDVNQPPGWPTGYGDPSTWTYSGGQYRDEWQADHMLDVTTSINNKMGWVIMDLGSEIAGLDSMYLWNGVQIGTQAMDEFNIYHATSPVVPGTQGPTGGSDADDYDFGVAAWTQIGGTETLSDGGGGGSADGVYALGGITARYVALEMLSRHNGNTDPNSGRIGFQEAGFTFTAPAATPAPEPSTMILAALGLVSLVGTRRRRRR